MELSREILEQIEKNRFALLPPRIYRKKDDAEQKKEEDKGRYSVQCQICGRMGAMTIEDMEKHLVVHLEQQKGNI